VIGLNLFIRMGKHHRLLNIDTHLAYFVLWRTLVQEKIVMLNQFLTKQSKYRKSGSNMSTFLHKRKRYVNKMTCILSVLHQIKIMYIPDFEDFHYFFMNRFSITIFFAVLLYSIVYSVRWISICLNLWKAPF